MADNVMWSCESVRGVISTICVSCVSLSNRSLKLSIVWRSCTMKSLRSNDVVDSCAGVTGSKMRYEENALCAIAEDGVVLSNSTQLE